MWPQMVVDSVVFSLACWGDGYNYDYGCSDEPRNIDPQPTVAPTQLKETWHTTRDNACGIFEFDDANCPGLKDKLLREDFFLPGSCPSSHSKACDSQTIEDQNLGNSKTFVDVLIADMCEPDHATTFTFLCGDSRMKTFHQILDSGLCVYVDVDDRDCPDMQDYLLEVDQGYVRGPCPDKYLQSYCDEKQKFELDFVKDLTNLVLSSQCGWDTSDLEYDYACEQREEMKCPEECANAIASDPATAFIEDGVEKYTGFCGGIDSDATKPVRFVDLLPDACDKSAISKCVGEIYKKCDLDHEERVCPFSDYGFPPLQNCHPTTCAEWKEAAETGCGKDLSKCVKDEAQGLLECKPDGTPLPKPSHQSCGDTEKWQIECTKGEEFCNFDDGDSGSCELCSQTLCVLLDTQKARDECSKRCGNDDCMPNPQCLEDCPAEPKTCYQLEQWVQDSRGCAKECNQCMVNMYNKKLQCSDPSKGDGDKGVQSWVDGDSAASLSIFMLSLIAIYQF